MHCPILLLLKGGKEKKLHPQATRGNKIYSDWSSCWNFSFSLYLAQVAKFLYVFPSYARSLGLIPPRFCAVCRFFSGFRGFLSSRRESYRLTELLRKLFMCPSSSLSRKSETFAAFFLKILGESSSMNLGAQPQRIVNKFERKEGEKKFPSASKRNYYGLWRFYWVSKRHESHEALFGLRPLAKERKKLFTRLDSRRLSYRALKEIV